MFGIKSLNGWYTFYSESLLTRMILSKLLWSCINLQGRLKWETYSFLAWIIAGPIITGCSPFLVKDYNCRCLKCTLAWSNITCRINTNNAKLSRVCAKTCWICQLLIWCNKYNFLWQSINGSSISISFLLVSIY